MSSPRSTIVPERIGIRPNSALRNVDFPAPFGPMIPTSSPSNNVRLQPLRMFTSGTYPATTSVATRSGPSHGAVGTSSIPDSSDIAIVSPFFFGDDRRRFLELPGLFLCALRHVVMATEVGIDHVRVGADRVGRPFGNDAALGEHDHPVADVVHDVHVVLDEDHATACDAKDFEVGESRIVQHWVSGPTRAY